MSCVGVTQLLFTTRSDVSVVDVADWLAGNVTSSRPRSIVSGLDGALAVDYVWTDASIYWTDLTLGQIYRASVNVTSRPATVVDSGVETPDGLACDWVGRKLYWADSETHRVEVANLDGTMRRVLYWRDIDQPRAIALDPTHGYLAFVVNLDIFNAVLALCTVVSRIADQRIIHNTASQFKDLHVLAKSIGRKCIEIARNVIRRATSDQDSMLEFPNLLLLTLSKIN